MTNCDTVSGRGGLTIYLFQGGFMATDQSDKGSKAAGSAKTQAGAQPKIVWDDSNMRSVYANVSNVAGTREEIVLLFGMNQAWHAGQKEVKVQLTDRIVLSPFAAKRFSMLLNNVLQDYEKRYGTPSVFHTVDPDEILGEESNQEKAWGCGAGRRSAQNLMG
jgi:hypothetical protein